MMIIYLERNGDMEESNIPKMDGLEIFTENLEESRKGAMFHPNESDSYIEKRLQGQMNYYHKECSQLQKEYNGLSIFNIVITALIPLFTLAINDWDFSKYIVVALGALDTVTTSILLLHKTKENQVNYRSTYENLKKEYIYYINSIEKYKDKSYQESRELFIETCENLMQSEHGIWGNLSETEENIKRN